MLGLIRRRSLGQSPQNLNACEIPEHPGWYVVQYADGPNAGGVVAAHPLSKAEVENITSGENVTWINTCTFNKNEPLLMTCNTGPNTKSGIDLWSGNKFGESEGQVPQPHALCPAAASAPAPAPPAPEPQGVQPIPISVDIQAFTPQGTGPIPAQPLPQLQPPPQPMSQPEPAVPQVKWIAPKPAEKTLDTGSALGIGAVVIAAIATAFFGGK